VQRNEVFLRTVVVGTSGSGKSTFAAKLASSLGAEHSELDAIFWRPGWKSIPEEQFVGDVAEIADRESWVIDGNYAPVRDYVWRRATAVVWLDLPLHRTFLRLLRRTIRRATTGETCCNGNKESLRMAFLSRDSVLLWALQSHRRYVADYTELLQCRPELSGFRLKSDRAVRDLLQQVKDAA